MSAKVVDASAISALLLDETNADSVSAQLENAQLFAPALLAFEFANVCVTKSRTFPGRHEAILGALAAFEEMLIELHSVDLAETIFLAQRHRLSAYDASYLWLARELGAELITLDAKLERAYADVARR